MSDLEFWRNAFIAFIYFIGVAFTWLVVWEKSRHHYATTVVLSIMWFVFFPIAYLYLAIERVTTWRR